VMESLAGAEVQRRAKDCFVASAPRNDRRRVPAFFYLSLSSPFAILAPRPSPVSHFAGGL